MRTIAALATLLGAATGCSALVNPEDEPIKCVIPGSGIDPCEIGMACIEGTCRVPPTPMCTPEVCDTLDNDCDGRIDEVDLDGDTAYACSGDCDDTDPMVNPSATEICDGRDNDCNGTFDTEIDLCPMASSCVMGVCRDMRDCTFNPFLCRAGEFCNTMLQPPMCEVAMMGGCRDTGCPMTQLCNKATGMCEDRPTLGASCGADADCAFANAICVPRSVTLTSGPSANVCTRACCSNADCPEGGICWMPGNGTRLCMPASMLPPEVMYTPCTSTCGDGVCGRRTMTVGGRTIPVYSCGAPVGSGRTGDSCSEPSHCISGVCIGSTQCGQLCGRTSDCPSGTYCEYLTARESGSVLTACIDNSDLGGGTTGDDCCLGGFCSAAVCRDATCIRGRCADMCCTDADCSRGRCRPTDFGGFGILMYCN